MAAATVPDLGMCQQEQDSDVAWVATFPSVKPTSGSLAEATFNTAQSLPQIMFTCACNLVHSDWNNQNWTIDFCCSLLSEAVIQCSERDEAPTRPCKSAHKLSSRSCRIKGMLGAPKHAAGVDCQNIE